MIKISSSKIIFSLIIAAIIILALSMPSSAQTFGDGNINLLPPWLISNSNLVPRNPTYGVTVPSLANKPCLGTDAFGNFGSGTCSGGGGGAAGTFSTTTVAGRLLQYPYTSLITSLGGNSTTTSPWFFDPVTLEQRISGPVTARTFTATSTSIASIFPYASTTALTASGNIYITSSTTNGLSFINSSAFGLQTGNKICQTSNFSASSDGNPTSSICTTVYDNGIDSVTTPIELMVRLERNPINTLILGAPYAAGYYNLSALPISVSTSSLSMPNYLPVLNIGSQLQLPYIATPGLLTLSGGVVQHYSGAILQSLNGDTSNDQLLQTGTTGSDFNIVDDGMGTHTFNIPTASATARGLITSAMVAQYSSTSPTYGRLYATTSLSIPPLGSPGGSYLAVTPSGLVIATTTPTGGGVSGGTAGMLASWTSGSTLTATGTPTAASYVATSSTASIFPYASTTALSVAAGLYASYNASGTLAYHSAAGKITGNSALTYDGNTLSVNNLNVLGPLSANVIPLQDTAANLSAVVASSGQMVYETDTKYSKAGDGLTALGNIEPVGYLRKNASNGSKYYLGTSTSQIVLGSSTPTASTVLPYDLNLYSDSGGGYTMGTAGTKNLNLYGESIFLSARNLGNIFFQLEGGLVGFASNNYPDSLLSVSDGGSVTLGDCGGDINNTCFNIDDSASRISVNSSNGFGVNVNPTAILMAKGSGTGTGRTFALTNSANTENMTVLDNGNVGLGTTSPYARLSVAGRGIFNQDVRANYFTATSTTATSTFAGGVSVGTANSTGQLTIQNAATTIPNIMIKDFSGTDSFSMRQGGSFMTISNLRDTTTSITSSNAAIPFDIVYSTGQIGIGAGNGAGNSGQSTVNLAGSMSIGDYALSSGGAPAPTKGLTVSGNVGLGTSTPWTKLGVDGTIAFNNTGIAGGNCVTISPTTKKIADAGSGTCSTSSKWTKHDIESLPDTEVIALVEALQPIMFSYNFDDTDRIGLIAEEVDALSKKMPIASRLVFYAQNDVPEIQPDGTTHIIKKGEPYAVDYSGVTILLARYVQIKVGSDGRDTSRSHTMEWVAISIMALWLGFISIKRKK